MELGSYTSSNTEKRLSSFIISIIHCLSFIFLIPFAFPAENHPTHIAIVVSLERKPYVDAVESLNAVLTQGPTNIDIKVFQLEKFEEKDRTILKKKILSEKFDLFIAIGPEAARFVWTELQNTGTTMIYSVVLNPEKIAETLIKPCGISLNIPVKIQIREISILMPFVKRLGLLYDPTYNAAFFESAKEHAGTFGIQIIPMPVMSRKELPEVLKKSREDIDALWLIPDHTVTSESLIQYIIKESLIKKLPVIGYTRFFYESGAVFSFVFDFSELGAQTAELAISVLAGNPCESGIPKYHILLNDKVIKRLDIQVKQDGKER